MDVIQGTVEYERESGKWRAMFCVEAGKILLSSRPEPAVDSHGLIIGTAAAVSLTDNGRRSTWSGQIVSEHVPTGQAELIGEWHRSDGNSVFLAHRVVLRDEEHS